MDYKFINTEYLDSVSGEDNNIMLEIVNIFKEQVAEMQQEMRTLLSEKNYHSLGLLAHKAKSSVAIMGMDKLASMLRSFEMQAKEGTYQENYDSYVKKFVNDTGEAMKELDDLISKRLKQE